MGYRNSTLYTLKYVAGMLGEDEDFLHECSIEMFSEDGIENLKYIVEARKDAAGA